jgi:serine/threonine protein kinase
VEIVFDRKVEDDYEIGGKLGEGVQVRTAQEEPERPGTIKSRLPTESSPTSESPSRLTLQLRPFPSHTQGVVFAGVCKKTGAKVAVKRTHIGSYGSSASRASAFAEIELLSYCDHPNVLRLMGAYQTGGDINMVCGKVEGWHLIKYLIALDKEEAAGRSAEDIASEKMSLMHQLVDAVAHVHSRDMVYRDLKPANLMVSETKPRQLVLIDFGRATHLDRAARLEKEQPMGTSLFQAPEVEERAAYGQQSDMWAVGVLIYLLVSGSMPFEHSIAGLYKVLAGAYKPMDEGFSPEAKDLVSKLLVVDPDKRLNAAQCTQHPFFTQEGVVAAKAIIAKLPRTTRLSVGCIHALEMHKHIVGATCQTMAEQLGEEDLDTLRHWMAMSTEEQRDNKSNENSYSGKRGTGSARSLLVGREDSQARMKNLESLYQEMREIGEGSVRFRGGVAKMRRPPSVEDMSKHIDNMGGLDLKPVSEGKRMSMDAVRPSPWNTMEDPSGMRRVESDASLNSDEDSGKGGTAGSGGKGGERKPPSRGGSRHGGTFLSVAHLHGLCSLDELIAACHSCGCEPLADELERVKESLREKRIHDLIEAGVKTTESSNALLDTMLFRYDELFQKVVTLQVELKREREAKEAVEAGLACAWTSDKAKSFREQRIRRSIDDDEDPRAPLNNAA